MFRFPMPLASYAIIHHEEEKSLLLMRSFNEWQRECRPAYSQSACSRARVRISKVGWQVHGEVVRERLDGMVLQLPVLYPRDFFP